MNKKLMIAAAGAGKTTYLINRALEKESKVLITTYTRSNEDEIKNKIYNQLGYIPSNIDMQTWFEFLLRHGVRPFQGTMDDSLFDKNIGFVLTNNKSAMYIKESDIMKHYFTKEIKIYSDKISKFIIKCNERLNGEVISRITKIYPRIFIDEIQDLVGYDLDVIKLLVNSDAEILMVGDPRQTTYTTHPTDRYKKYQHGKTAEFIENELNKKHEICKIDKETLNQSHRNNNKICSFSSKLYPNLPKPDACECDLCRNYEYDHIGIFFLHERYLSNYLSKFNPVQLRWDSKKKPDPSYAIYNFGESKGLSFDRVIIYPTKEMKNWIKNNSVKLAEITRAKIYVAITRARKSVAIVVDDDMDENITDSDCCFYNPNTEKGDA